MLFAKRQKKGEHNEVHTKITVEIQCERRLQCEKRMRRQIETNNDPNYHDTMCADRQNLRDISGVLRFG